MPRSSESLASQWIHPRRAETGTHKVHNQGVRSHAFRCEQTQAFEDCLCQAEGGAHSPGSPVGGLCVSFKVKLGLPERELSQAEGRADNQFEGYPGENAPATERDLGQGSPRRRARGRGLQRERGVPGGTAHSTLGYRAARRARGRRRSHNGASETTREQGNASLWKTTTNKEAQDQPLGSLNPFKRWDKGGQRNGGSKDSERYRWPPTQCHQGEWNYPNAPDFTRQQGEFEYLISAAPSRRDLFSRQQHQKILTSYPEEHSLFPEHTLCKDNVSSKNGSRGKDTISIHNATSFHRDNRKIKYALKANLPTIIDCFGETRTTDDLQKKSAFGNRSQFCGILPDLRLQGRIQDSIIQTCIAVSLATFCLVWCTWLSIKGILAVGEGVKTATRNRGNREKKMVMISEVRHDARGTWKAQGRLGKQALLAYLIATTWVDCPLARVAQDHNGNQQHSPYEEAMTTRPKFCNHTDTLTSSAGGTAWFEQHDSVPGCVQPWMRCNELQPDDRLADEPELSELRRRVREAMEEERQERRQIANRHTRMNRSDDVWLEIRALAQHENGRRFGVRMYGLKHLHVDTRDRQANMNILRDRTGFLVWLREQWQDAIQMHDTIEAIYVTPQPTPYTCGVDQLHLIIDHGLDTTIPWSPVTLCN